MDWLNKIPVKNKDIAWRIVDSEALIVFLPDKLENKEILFLLNETATEIWKLIDGKNCLLDIFKKVSEIYDTDSNKIKFEVKGVIDDMVDKKLIKIL